MMKWLSLGADILTVISAIITVVSALSIRKYYNKIVRQYSVEELTLSEQHIHTAIETIQKLKRIYLSDKRGLTENKVNSLYLDIDDNLNNILFDLPSSFDSIMECLSDAREEIKLAIEKSVILTKNSHFEELEVLLNTISLNIKKEKEKIQRENMK